VNAGFGLFISHEILDIPRMLIRETGTNGRDARFDFGEPKGAYLFCGRERGE